MSLVIQKGFLETLVITQVHPTLVNMKEVVEIIQIYNQINIDLMHLLALEQETEFLITYIHQPI